MKTNFHSTADFVGSVTFSPRNKSKLLYSNYRAILSFEIFGERLLHDAKCFLSEI